MRPATACHACRSVSCRSGSELFSKADVTTHIGSVHRRKCRPARPGAPCSRCISLNTTCSLAKRFMPSGLVQKRALNIDSNGDSPTATVHDENLWPPESVREELVNLYFKYIHDKHHSLFHQPTFMELLGRGKVPKVLLCAMMALAARFSKSSFFANSHPWERGRPLARKCKGLLDLRNISLTTIQACVLLGTICFAEAEAEAEALYYSVANRLALMLDLLYKPTKTELERQLNLRVWWTLYMIDIWSSAGVRLPRQMHKPSIAPLPMEEDSFLRLSQGTMMQDLPPRNVDNSEGQLVGLWAQMAQLAQIFGEIHDLNETTVRQSVDQATLQASVTGLAGKLNRWLIDLPSQMRMSPENLASYASRGLGQTFAALHLGYHHYNQLLFYQFLAADCHPSVDPASEYADTCKSHAASLCDLLYDCYKTPGCECLYIMIGHMLVVASTVHIHTLLFSPQEYQIAQARCRLERNFETLMRLQQYWPNLELSLSRLRSFHNACLTSMDTSFRMDQWMLRFLLEHGNVVGDKFAQDGSPPEILSKADQHDTESPSWMPSIREWYVHAFQGVS